MCSRVFAGETKGQRQKQIKMCKRISTQMCANMNFMERK